MLQSPSATSAKIDVQVASPLFVPTATSEVPPSGMAAP
jgi:hypothetical protein